MAAHETDRNLLFGVLALQAELIDNDRFAEACAAWSARKATPLGELMVERGWLAAADRALVDRLLEVKLQKHGGDAARSLADVAEGPARQALAKLGDAEIQNTIARLPHGDGHVILSTIAYTPEMRERYTLTRLHAKGGIGRVWLAHDADLGRNVALKELLPEQASNPAVWARFQEEARITGQLEHPNIVPVHELVRPEGKEGEGDDGSRQPFYTMRFVKGRTLTDAIRDYHRRRKEGQTGSLDLLVLLQAFRGVCNAVAYAHARGVIHRDIKGQNVVLGDFGEVIVLDWGLAKLVDREETHDATPPVRLRADSAHDATIQGQALGTPAYMSPEQAEGRIDRVSPRSDVYGLGAMLYEILAGVPPFTGSDTQDVLRRVREEEPPRPRSVNRAAPKALEAVCLKAMAKKPEERYATAEELGQEVERWLADEPVTAWREPWTIRTRRWLWRNRLLVTTGAAAGVVAIAGLVALVMVQNRANVALQASIDREKKAKDLAEARFNLAANVIGAFYSGVSEDVMLKQPKLQDLRKRLLETALGFYNQMRDQLKSQPDEPGQPNLRTDRLSRLAGDSEHVAEIYTAIGQHADAVRVYNEALTNWEELGVERYPVNVGKVLVKLGRLKRQMGQPAEAMKDFKRSVAIFEDVAKSNRYYIGDLAWALLQVGSLQQETGLLEEAMHNAERGRDITLEKARSDRLLPWERQDLGALYTVLGNLAMGDRRIDEAYRNHEQSLDILEKLAKEFATSLEFRADWARAENNLGYDLTEKGSLEEALTKLEHGRKMREEMLAAVPLSAAYRSDLGRSEYYLARLHVRAGRAEDALHSLEKAESLFAGIPTLAPEDRFYRACLLALYIPTVGMGKTQLNDQERAEREQYSEKAIQALRDAIAHGFKNKAAIANEPDLEPLRTRADFKKMMSEMGN